MPELRWEQDSRKSYRLNAQSGNALAIVVMGKFYDANTDTRAKLMLIFTSPNLRKAYDKFSGRYYFTKIDDVRETMGKFFNAHPELGNV